jgi:hypothetical protein
MEIHSHIDYIWKELPLALNERIIIFEKCLGLNESLFRGKISKKLLKFTPAEYTYSRIEKYFLEKKYLEVVQENELDRGNNRDLEDFIKLCWLTDEYLTNGFNNPINVHYNPRIKKNVIHPGGSRNQIINLFQTSPVDCLYFNTGGVYFDWMKDFKKIDIKNLIGTNDLDLSYVALVADHGSIIPHIHLQANTIPSGIFKFYNVIKENLKTIKIKSNVNIHVLSNFLSTSDYNVCINFKNTENFEDICRAVLMSVLKRNYASDSLSIEIV